MLRKGDHGYLLYLDAWAARGGWDAVRRSPPPRAVGLEATAGARPGTVGGFEGARPAGGSSL